MWCRNMGHRVGLVMLTVSVEVEGGVADGDLPLEVETYAHWRSVSTAEAGRSWMLFGYFELL